MNPAPRTTTRGATAPTPHTGRPVVVLDTSAIMSDPVAHLSYPGADIVIPLTVVDELGQNKSRPDSAGRNARAFLRILEQLRQDNAGTLLTPAPLPEDATVRVAHNGLRVDKLREHHLDPSVADHRILAAALGCAGESPVTVVSNDTALRLKASVVALDAIEHTPGRTGMFAPHRTGHHTLPLTAATIAALKGRAPVPIVDLPAPDRALLEAVLDNEFVIAAGTALSARRKGESLTPVHPSRPRGLKARNKEQEFALDLLADPEIRLTALRGRAGTGKTMLALAAGLDAVLDKHTHDRLVILRPMHAVGRQDLGYLPGDIAEKTQPWFAAVVDCLVALSTDPAATFASCSAQLQEWIAASKVELSPLTFLRGRSLTRSWVILDEAQNISADDARTVISRLGEGSTLVLTGDDSQLDTPFASALTCGLNVAVDAFAGVDLFGQVFFTRGERSRLANLAAERL